MRQSNQYSVLMFSLALIIPRLRHGAAYVSIQVTKEWIISTRTTFRYNPAARATALESLCSRLCCLGLAWNLLLDIWDNRTTSQNLKQGVADHWRTPLKMIYRTWRVRIGWYCNFIISFQQYIPSTIQYVIHAESGKSTEWHTLL